MKPVNAAKDFLTNCYTREAFIPFLKRMEEEYLTAKKPFALLMMDVDHFKSFNDKFGHLYGDEVLKYFSSSLRLDLEDEENVPFRFGGDEFVMVFPNKTTQDAYRLASRLRKNIRTRSCLIKGRQLSITFSGGITGYPADANNLEALIEKADKALYYSKNHGRGRITKYSDLAQKEFLQLSLIFVILAIVGALFFFYRDTFSTQVNRLSGRIAGWVPKSTPPQTAAAPVGLPEVPAVPEEGTAPASAGTEEASQATAVEAPAEISEILLESGRVVKGVIKHEDEDVLELELGLQEGKGLLQIKKSQVMRIRRSQ